MKKILYIMIATVLSAMSLVSCDKGLVDEVEQLGKVSFKGFGVTVLNDEEVIEGRSSSVDVSIFKVNVQNKITGVKVNSWTYSEMPEIVELPVGSYTVEVYNAEVKNAAWESPYFYGVKDFEVKKNDIAIVENVVCKLANLKVSIKYSNELKNAIGTGEDVKVNVLVGENSSLDFAYNETRAGYFRCDNENKSLVATFSGSVDGFYITEYKVISDVAAGQHRIITFSLQTPPDVTDETGLVGTSGFSVSGEVTTIDLTENIPVDEELIQPDDFLSVSDDVLNFGMKASSKGVTVNASAEWSATSNAQWCSVSPATGVGGESTLTISVTDNMVEAEREAVVTVVMGDLSYDIAVKQAAYSEQPIFDAPSITSSTIDLNAVNVVTASSIVDVDVLAPGKIAKFNVKISMSDGNGGVLDLSSVGLANEFDLCNPGAYKDGLVGLGLPVNEQVKGKTEMKFDISGFMGLLVIYSGDHVFNLEVVDELGQSTSATLKLKVD